MPLGISAGRSGGLGKALIDQYRFLLECSDESFHSVSCAAGSEVDCEILSLPGYVFADELETPTSMSEVLAQGRLSLLPISA